MRSPAPLDYGLETAETHLRGGLVDINGSVGRLKGVGINYPYRDAPLTLHNIHYTNSQTDKKKGGSS